MIDISETTARENGKKYIKRKTGLRKEVGIQS